ncbi:ionotropic receptor 75a-like [Acyrthosiphon pisum]|uniref:Ionotropic glutamate receptor C-terminal domain-containing protein n=1 Tax=Acyrthosiphon pisum TaxID=7029 RepID=A0A8R2JV73_ACYPI|nr:ionotropic receptor 75a-like [Acyrthosiphon pisum]
MTPYFPNGSAVSSAVYCKALKTLGLCHATGKGLSVFSRTVAKNTFLCTCASYFGVSNNRLFNLQNDWLLFNQKSISNTSDTLTIASVVFETYLGKSYVLPDSGVFLFQKIGNNVWEIWSGFRASKLDTIRVYKTGLASKYHIEINDSTEIRMDFRGATLKATTVIFNPSEFIGFNQTITSGLDVYTYMHYPMIQILGYQLNFNYTISITDDHGWSNGNGSFSGLIGILQREESDFGAAGSLMRLDRMTAVDFTVGTVSLESNILFKQPMLSSITNIHIKPFKYEVWQITLYMLIGFVLILLFLNKFKANRSPSITVLDIIGLVHGAICQQGYTIVLILNSIKIVVFVLFLTTFFLFNAYSASIVSLFQSTSSSINNVKDFLHEKSMTMSIQIASYAKPYFNETTNEILRKLYDMKIKPYDENNSFTDAQKGIERIRTEFHGFMVEKTSAYQIINKKWREEEKCGLYEIQLFKLPVLAIPVVKKSGHKDVFKQKYVFVYVLR